MRFKTRSRNGNAIITKEDRVGSSAVAIGDIVNFGGFWHYCVLAGTTGALEPVIISATGASNLISNSFFDESTSGWTPTNATLSSNGGFLTVTNTASSIGIATQNITVKNLSGYLVSVSQKNGTTGGKIQAVGAATLLNDALSYPIWFNTLHLFTADQVSVDIRAICNSATIGRYSMMDEITVEEVTIDGTCAWKNMGEYIF